MLAAIPFLYVLAALSLSFASLSSIVILLRQMTGGTPSPHHVLLFRLVLESSLTNTAASVLPPLLALFGLGPARVWHVAGALAFTVMLAHFVSYPYRRRHAAPNQPMGALGWGNIALLFCGPALLVLDVAGVSGVPAGALYALALYLRLLGSGCVFFANFAFFVRQDSSAMRATSGFQSAKPPLEG